jgi:type III protein arginine methyltransferase
MTDWSGDLSTALASGDPAFMKAMMARVPKDVLHQAVPFLEEMARQAVQDSRFDEALTYYDQLIEIRPGKLEWHTQRARVYFKLDRLVEALEDARRIIELAPEEVLGHRLQAEAHDGLRERPQALSAYRQVLKLEPGDQKARQRIQFLETELRKAQVLRQALDPAAPQEDLKIELPPPPKVTFDPALFDDAAIDESFEKFRVDGLRQHLWRYSGQQSARNALARIEDPAWLAAWAGALRAVAGKKVLFHGSELGLFALRARQCDAAHVRVAESFPLDARITGGIVQKHLLGAWHALHGSAVQAWSEEERRQSFDSFTSGIDIGVADEKQSDERQYDYFVFPNVDHSLLGTGIVKAVRRYCGERAAATRVLPARATVFAMAIQWTYGSMWQLGPMNELRWSLYPQALDATPGSWTALTTPVRLGEIDFENFTSTAWNVQLPANASGTVDAIVFWFDLSLGDVQISSAPGSDLQCIKPAVQYTDHLPLQAGQSLPLKVHVKDTRLYFETQPAASRPRASGLPSWYVPMLLDRYRNDAYQVALDKALSGNEAQTVLDIGAGCGLLSMMAARAGAGKVVGCEMRPSICRAAREIIGLNAFADRITLVNKDCRNMQVPDDMAERADLAVFELFDCSLIGEGVLHFLAHAREHLLRQNARYLPMAARLRACLVEYRLDRIWDIDVNLLNPYRSSPSFINVDAGRLPYRALTAPFDLFSFDFLTATAAADSHELRIPVTAAGTVGAVMFWFDLQLDATSWISNAPDAPQPLHWRQGLQFLPEVQVDTSMQLPLIAKHDGSSLTVQWQQNSLPPAAISKLPRFDPRWLAASQELEQQTQGLLQHCMQNPDEYTKVAQLALRFAIDPAAHGLDPAIAQRFAAMFLEG